MLTKSLDRIIFENYKDMNIDFIKIDTDGYDFAVIRSAKNILKNYKPWIYFEWEYQYLIENKEDIYSIFVFLSDHGYGEIFLFDHVGEPLFKVSAKDKNLLYQCMQWTQKENYADVNRRINYFDVLCIPDDSVCQYEEFLLKWYL